MDHVIKEILGRRWRIKSIQRFGYMIECVDNPCDVRRLSRKGWEQYVPVV